MSANLRKDAFGVGQVFSVRESMWHGDGHILQDAPDHEAARRLAGHEFTIGLKPLYIPGQVEIVGGALDGTMREGFVPTGTGQAIVREDNGAVLGITGDQYGIIQPWEIDQLAEPLVDAGVAEYATGGTLGEGQDTWMLLRFKIEDARVREVFGQEIVPYACLTNNYSSKRRAMLIETPVRVVCQNTLTQALGNYSRGVSVVHRGNARVRLIDAAQEMFASLVERYVAIAEDYAALRERILTVEEFTRTVLDVAMPLPAEPKVQSKDRAVIARQETARAKAEDVRRLIERAWTAGTGHTGDHSAWEAFNGVVECYDHAGIGRTRGSLIESNLFGTIGNRKAEIMGALVKLSRGGAQ